MFDEGILCFCVAAVIGLPAGEETQSSACFWCHEFLLYKFTPPSPSDMLHALHACSDGQKIYNLNREYLLCNSYNKI